MGNASEFPPFPRHLRRQLVRRALSQVRMVELDRIAAQCRIDRRFLVAPRQTATCIAVADGALNVASYQNAQSDR